MASSSTSRDDARFLPAGRSATTYSIPFDTLTVGEAAFVANGALTSMVVGNNVTTIQSYAFKAQPHSPDLTIGSSVQTIGDGAFSGTEALTAVRLFQHTHIRQQRLLLQR